MALNSPNLNPIEIVWNLMKQWIQDYYGVDIDNEDKQVSYE
jgi:hypothetical protein